MEIELTRISEKGQIVIPSSLRREMNINKSDKFLVFGENNTIILKKIDQAAFKKSFKEVSNPLQKMAKQSGLSKKELEKAIRDVRNA